jgi:hypothetical protein
MFWQGYIALCLQCAALNNRLRSTRLKKMRIAPRGDVLQQIEQKSGVGVAYYKSRIAVIP